MTAIMTIFGISMQTRLGFTTVLDFILKSFSVSHKPVSAQGELLHMTPVDMLMLTCLLTSVVYLQIENF